MANETDPLVFFRLQVTERGGALIVEAPASSKVKPALSLSWDINKKLFRLSTGVTADDQYYDANEFPEWLRGRLFTSPSNVPLPLRHGGGSIPMPECAAIRNSKGGFLSFVEYDALRRALKNSVARSSSPLYRSTQAAAVGVVYPPLTRSVYDLYVGHCLGQELFKK